MLRVERASFPYPLFPNSLVLHIVVKSSYNHKRVSIFITCLSIALNSTKSLNSYAAHPMLLIHGTGRTHLLVRVILTSLPKIIFKPFAEVVHAVYCVDDGYDDENNRDQGECGEGLSYRLVVFLPNTVIRQDSGGLEDEIRQCAKIENDCNNHAPSDLSARAQGGSAQDDERDWHSGDGETKFRIAATSDY